MTQTLKPCNTLIDRVTGREVPNIGAEENRQAVERYLIDHKGYASEDIEVGVELNFSVKGEAYRSRVDLVVKVDGTRLMVVTCAAGSLGSWERQTLAAARLLDTYRIPFAAVSDGKTASVLDSGTGENIGAGLDSLPSKSDLHRRLGAIRLEPLTAERREREMLIFRTYDRDRVNVQPPSPR
jgi:hypothetical protein